MGNPVPEDPISEDPPALEPAPPPSRLPQIPALRQTPGQFASKSAVHLRTAGSALVNWWRAVTIEGLCVAVLWLIGLLIAACAPGPSLGPGRRAHDPGPQLRRRDRAFGTCFFHPGQPTQHVPSVFPARAVCGDCGDRSIDAATFDYEASDPRAHLGFDPGPHRSRDSYSVLGDFTCAPFARHRLRFPPASSPFPSRSVTLVDMVRFFLTKTAQRASPASRGGKSPCRRKPPHVSAILAFRRESYGQFSRQ